MFMPPRRPSFTIFADENSKPYACTAVAIIAACTEFHQAVGQFVVVSRRGWWGNGDRLSRSRAIFWRNNDPRSVGPLLITSTLVITIATWPRLALCRDSSTGYTADDCTSCRPSAAAHCAANDGPGKRRPGLRHLLGLAQPRPVPASQAQWPERLKLPKVDTFSSPS